MMGGGNRVVVAVSGGADSVCLLDVLYHLREEWDLQLVVAHFDHGFRPKEDEAETQVVRELASAMKLPFETEKMRWGSECPSSSLEEKAREARYAFLQRLATEICAQKIAVGHTLDDQAETVIMRLLRGSGPLGLSGIPPLRGGGIIRPLLEIKREDILAYLVQRHLSYVTDSSNMDTRFLRNRIRLELMPLLLTYQPRLTEHLGELALLMRDENQFMDSLAREWVKREAEVKTTGETEISVAAFNALGPSQRNRVTRLLLAGVKKDLRRIGRNHIEAVSQVATAFEPQRVIHLPAGTRVRKTYNRLTFSRTGDEKHRPFFLTVRGPGTFFIEEIRTTFDLIEIDRDRSPMLRGSSAIALIDADKIRYPLIIRNIRPGDRFIPLGMKGHRKIKDFFIDLKICAEERARTPILLCSDIPVWVCGYRIDDRFKITPGTRRILKICFRN